MPRASKHLADLASPVAKLESAPGCPALRGGVVKRWAHQSSQGARSVLCLTLKSVPLASLVTSGKLLGISGPVFLLGKKKIGLSFRPASLGCGKWGAFTQVQCLVQKG